MTIGYVIVNDEHPGGPIVCDEESAVYRDRLTAEREARQLRREHGNPGIKVYELVSPGTLYILSEEDVFDVAKEKRIGKKKVRNKMGQIQKRIEDGFAYNWHDVVETAIDVALSE